jgi:hypothetical protein
VNLGELATGKSASQQLVDRIDAAGEQVEPAVLTAERRSVLDQTSSPEQVLESGFES